MNIIHVSPNVLSTLMPFQQENLRKLKQQILLLVCDILGNMCIAIVCKPGCDVLNFEVDLIFLIFLIKPLFLHDQKILTKTLKS